MMSKSIKSEYLHCILITRINLRSQFNARKENSTQVKDQKKSKGERLG